MNVPMVIVENLSKSYEKSIAVEGLSFKVAKGEIFGLLGPNGAGKTTTLEILGGLIQPDNGSVLFEGDNISSITRETKKKLGLVPQEFAFYPSLTARENLSFFGRLYGIKGVKLNDRINDVLKDVTLLDRSDDRVFRYSNGMKRCLNIAIALIHEPRVLLLDEPTVGIDLQSRNAILKILESLASEGVSIIYTTHYMEEAEKICNRIAIIDKGKFLIEGSTIELLSRLPRWNIEIAFEPNFNSELLVHLERLSNVKAIHKNGNNVRLEVFEFQETLSSLLNILKDNETQIRNLEVHGSNLETLFLYLTGRKLNE